MVSSITIAKPTTAFSQLTELLDYRASVNKDDLAFVVLDQDGIEIEKINYGDLIRLSKSIAAGLQGKTKQGDSCLLLSAPGLDFITALFGCIYAGLVAIPAYPPKKNKKNDRLWSVIEDANPACILLSQEIENMLVANPDAFEKMIGIPRMIIDRKSADHSDQYKYPALSDNDTILLQYTSGTTGNPLGTMINHAGIMHNSEVIKIAFGHDAKLTGVNWLPPYHDMGLIGTIFQPLYVGGKNIIITPFDFLRNPVIWLNAITKYKGTTAGCPNFALDLLVEKISPEQKTDIDLSSLKVLFCGSEPIRSTTLKNFTQAFEACGFTEDMFLPCYGLAENTLMVTGIHHSEKPEYLLADRQSLENTNKVVISSDADTALSFVSCGYPWLDDQVLIVDPEKCIASGEDTIGEIWTRSGSVCQGYWNQADKNEEIFNAGINGSKEGPFMKTGDLGFLHNGQLYIAGRIKDMIIIRGMNHFPCDIENTVEHSHPALQAHGCAAFSSEIDNHERLIIIQEIKRTAIRELNGKEVIEAIRSAISAEHEIPVFAIELISPGRMCKTTSGKIQHKKCESMWMDKALKSVYSWKQEFGEYKHTIYKGGDERNQENVQAWLINWLSNKVKISPESINPNMPILSYGLDSLGAVELEREVKEKFGIEIHLADFLENNTISALVSIGIENMLKDTG
jgi:acyl-CoA synthetase (AMP-forming)/AMP-acid ligase II/acyl carrier protein